MKVLSIYKHFRSKTHTSFTNTTLERHIILNLNFDEIDEIMRKHFNNHIKNHEENDVHCLLKLLVSTNRVRYIRIKPQSSLQYSFYVP